MEHKIKLVSKNLSTLKSEYGVSEPTMKKWLRQVPNLKVDKRETKDYTPKELEMIYKHLGVPGGEFEAE
ncbi:hypothetical protein QQ054_13115 [Oscillatoria amoena NRMC-F 0135]|jgi:hypothetical protein|nr:MAG: DUF4248 domain-containing protein [Bacteroidota bacterium]MDL5046961.1 hypothetical protein [Oscillatoria amoena NRMC-F 0135]